MAGERRERRKRRRRTVERDLCLCKDLSLRFVLSSSYTILHITIKRERIGEDIIKCFVKSDKVQKIRFFFSLSILLLSELSLGILGSVENFIIFMRLRTTGTTSLKLFPSLSPYLKWVSLSPPPPFSAQPTNQPTIPLHFYGHLRE